MRKLFRPHFILTFSILSFTVRLNGRLEAARDAREVTIRNLTGNPFYPSWYPGNKQVAMVAYQDKSGGNIVKVDLQSGQSETLTDPAVIRCGMPFVSPDGKIVFAGQYMDCRFRPPS